MRKIEESGVQTSQGKRECIVKRREREQEDKVSTAQVNNTGAACTLHVTHLGEGLERAVVVDRSQVVRDQHVAPPLRAS